MMTLQQPQRRSCVLLLLLSCSLSLTLAQHYACDPCIIREKIKLKAIVHGTRSSTFWQQIQASMNQAAKDMRVRLNLTLHDTFDTTTMASDILAAASHDPAPASLIVTMYVYIVYILIEI
jgi:ABC-type sugar transport system substrate-binding protein